MQQNIMYTCKLLPILAILLSGLLMSFTGGGNTNAASGTGNYVGPGSQGDAVTVNITSPKNLASIDSITINGKLCTGWTVSINVEDGIKEVSIVVALPADTPANSEVKVTGTTVAQVPAPGTTLGVTTS